MKKTVIFSATFQLLAVAVPVIWAVGRYILAEIVIFLVFYLIALLLLSRLGMRTSFGRQDYLRLGVALLALGTVSSGLGFALSRRYPDAMSAPAVFILLLMFSAVLLIPWGIFFTLVPFRRRLAIVAYSVAFVLIFPTASLLMAAFAFR